MKTFHLFILCAVGVALLTLQPAASATPPAKCSKYMCRTEICGPGFVSTWTGPGCCSYTCKKQDCTKVRCRMPTCPLGRVPVKVPNGRCCAYVCRRDWTTRRLQGDGPYVKIGFEYKWDQLPEDSYDDEFDEETWREEVGHIVVAANGLRVRVLGVHPRDAAGATDA